MNQRPVNDFVARRFAGHSKYDIDDSDVFKYAKKRSIFLLFSLQRRLILAVTTIAFTCSGTPAQTPAPPQADNQIWTEYQLAIPLNHKTDIVALGVLRFGRNVSRPVNERIGAGISRKIGKYLTILSSYLHVASQPNPQNHSTEERITLEATPKACLSGTVLCETK